MAKKNTQSRSAHTSSRRPDRPRHERTVRSFHPVVLDALVCLIIAVLAVFVYRGYIIEGKTDITPDIVSQGAPFNRFAVEYEKRYDETPLWYPHIFGGMPFQASGTYHSLQYSFEALVNAVAHRDYSISGSKIRLFMFDDRLEIYSPGALPNTVTIDSMHLRQATRNELITSLLAETPVATAIGDVGRGFYMEKRGDGVPIILDESEKLSGEKPVYRLIDDSELLLTIYSAKAQ